MKRKLAWILLAAAALSVGLAAAVPAARLWLLGSWRGEPFADGQSQSYWLWALEHAGPQEREQAALTLGTLTPTSAPVVAALTDALEHDDSYIVCRISAESLGRLGPAARPATAALLRAATGPDARIRLAALRALGQIQPTAADVLPTLLDRAQHEADPPARSAAITAIGQLGADARPAIPMLLALMTEQAGSFADAGEAARHALQKVGVPAVPALLAACQNDDPQVRGRAAQTLGSMAALARPALPTLHDLLADADPLVRVRTAQALWLLEGKSENILPVLIKLLAEAPPPVQIEALATLSQLGAHGAGAVDSVRGCLTSQDATTRRLAAQTLAALGPSARVARAELARLAHDDPEPDVRRAATVSLEKLGPEK